MYISFSETGVSAYPMRHQPTSHLHTPCIINPCSFPAPCGYRSCIYLPHALSTHMVSHSAYYPENQRFQAFCSLQVATLWLSFTCLPTPCVINPYFCEGRLQLSCSSSATSICVYQHQATPLSSRFHYIRCYSQHQSCFLRRPSRTQPAKCRLMAHGVSWRSGTNATIYCGCIVL